MALHASKLYLLTYNTVLALGWLLILSKEIMEMFRGRTLVYPYIELELKIFQTAAVFEIFHAIFGLVKSPVSTTVIQVFSRLFIVWAVMHSMIDAQLSFGVVLCTLSWSVMEVIRYSFYSFSLIGHLPFWLLWLRYTLFIVLYPMGVTGELITSISALDEVNRHKIHSLELPNRANMPLSYYCILIVIMLMYIPLFPRMYLYMFGQRKKYLGQKID